MTLVELIVALSIVATLAAILLPATHGARAQARQIQCQGHIRDLMLEFQQYCQSEDGYFPSGFDPVQPSRPPPPGGCAGSFAFDDPGWWWFDYIEAVNHTPARSSGMAECPSRKLDDPALARNQLWGNYGVNDSVCRSNSDVYPYNRAFGPPGRRAGDIGSPGSTLLLTDSGYAVITWWHAADEPPVSLGQSALDTAYVPGLAINKDRQLRAGQMRDATGGRHPGKTVNVGFVDGHVERKKAAALLVQKAGDDTYLNLSPLWEP